MKRPSRGSLIAAALMLVAMMILGIATLVTSYRSYENTPSPYAAPLPPVPATPRVSGRVVVVVSDGLRYDAATQLPALAALAKRPDASMLRAQTGVPSLSEPGWTAIMTGAGPVTSGVRTNGYKGSPVPVESLFQTARSQGVKTALAGAAEEWEQLFRGQPDEVYVAPFPYGKGAEGDVDTDPLVRKALNGPAELMLLYFPAVDEASHEFGAASPEGVRAMQLFDQRVASIASGLDFGRDTLIVTSDHGHLDAGGHGGYEDVVRGSTLLAVGKGIRRSPVTDVSQLDIAPTIAALLGIPRPRDAEGRPLLESLAVDPELSTRIAEVQGAALRNRLGADYSTISGREAPSAEVEVLREDLASASWRRAVRESLNRLPAAIVVIGLLILAVLLAGGLSVRGVWSVVAGVGAIALAVVASGFTFSISWFSQPSDEISLLVSVIGGGMLASAIGGVVLGFGRPGTAWRWGIEFASTLALIAGALAVSLMVYYGPVTTWRLPDLRFSWAMFLLPVIAASAAIFSIPLSAGCAALAGKVGRSGSIRQAHAGAPVAEADADADDEGAVDIGRPETDKAESGEDADGEPSDEKKPEK